MRAAISLISSHVWVDTCIHTKHKHRHWREALAPQIIDRLLSLHPHRPQTTTGQPSAAAAIAVAFEQTQASLAALCVIALKWCPLPTFERLVPRLLQVRACVCMYGGQTGWTHESLYFIRPLTPHHTETT